MRVIDILKNYVRFLMLILFLANIYILNSISYAAYSPREEWVLTQVAAGKIADLKKFDEADLNLSASFLEKLLTNSLPNVNIQNEVYIKNAVVTEHLNIQRAKIPYAIFLLNCSFDDVDFKHAKFSGQVKFNNTTFRNAHFDYTTFSGDSYFAEVTFSGNADYPYAKFFGDATFWNAKFIENTIFKDVTFSSNADFSRSKFFGEINFSNCNFKDSSDFRACLS